ALAEIGDAVMLGSVGQADADRVDAVSGAQIGAQLHIGGRPAEIAPALVAVDDLGADGEGAGKEPGGGVRVSRLERLADPARGDAGAVEQHRADRLGDNAVLSADIAQDVNIAAAALAEGEIVAGDD